MLGPSDIMEEIVDNTAKCNASIFGFYGNSGIILL